MLLLVCLLAGSTQYLYLCLEIMSLIVLVKDYNSVACYDELCMCIYVYFSQLPFILLHFSYQFTLGSIGNVLQ
jgi:hypothetical protein